VYKARSADEHGKKKSGKEDGDDEPRDEVKISVKKSPTMLTAYDKQGSAIDLDIGPLLHQDQTEEYKKMQQAGL
jgi:hypothetical protein